MTTREKTMGYLFERGEKVYEFLEGILENMPKKRIKTTRDIYPARIIIYCGTPRSYLSGRVFNEPSHGPIKTEEISHTYLPGIDQIFIEADIDGEVVFASMVKDKFPNLKNGIKEAAIEFSNGIVMNISEFGKTGHHSLESAQEIMPAVPLKRDIRYNALPSSIIVLDSGGADINELEDAINLEFSEKGYPEILEGENDAPPLYITVRHIPKSNRLAFGKICATTHYENGKKTPEVKTSDILSRFDEIHEFIRSVYAPEFVRTINEVSSG